MNTSQSQQCSEADCCHQTNSSSCVRGCDDVHAHLACPCDAHAQLVSTASGLHCNKCGRTFSRKDGTFDLILGDRFEDDKCECMWCNEEDTGRFLAERYMAPLLHRIFGQPEGNNIKILSIGCGVGSDVEALNRLGYRAFGVDAGNRSEYWSRRNWPERYYLANGMHLPFQDESFDLAIMGCVLPHIGVYGDTYVTTPDYLEQRAKAAYEMVRVVKKGGYLLLSSPNRRCPVDFFHRPKYKTHMPRFHSPAEPFLMSVSDYATLLGQHGECRRIELLPLRGYWGFFSSSRYLLGRILQMPVRLYFNHFLSWKWTSCLRRTALNPWLILLVQR